MDKVKKARAVVVAKLVATKIDGSQIIVEVHQDSSWHDFYHWYTKAGTSRKKTFVRTSSRIADIQPPHMAARLKHGLHLILIRLNARKDIKEIFIKVIKKKLYRKMVSCSPNDKVLGGQNSNRAPGVNPFDLPRRHGAGLARVNMAFIRNKVNRIN